MHERGGLADREAPHGPAPLAPATHFVVGEQMVWDVFWRGVAIGTASLTVDTRGVRSSFRTGVLARALATVRYELQTTLVERVARAATELIVLGDETTRTELTLDGTRYHLNTRAGEVPGGTELHSLHSALGALRAWATPTAERSYLWLALGGRLYRLDAAPPVAESLDSMRTLRIECVVRALDPAQPQVDITVWLASSADRTPVRFVVETGGERIAAQLTETTAPLAAR